VGLLAILLLGLFLFRPGAARLKNRLAAALGSALQRQVEIGDVHIHILPRPSFDLDNFVVHDDPAFGAEPILRAQEVSAGIRIWALLRARLEISRLSLTEPSLNLVRSPQGRWNIESLLEHTQATSAAPTGQGTRSRPEFPYIQADRGRINFKLGNEKTPFTLSDADFALWQESEASWGMRLKAIPLRTDMNLSDTGLLRVNGVWQRAGNLRETPLQFTALWERAQLGQITRMLSGSDRGWRGTVRVLANLSGSPSELGIATDVSVEDFRRYDLAGGNTVRVAAHCDAYYASAQRRIHDIACAGPAGGGQIVVTGTATASLPLAEYDVAITAKDIAASSVVALAKRAKKDLPADLQATGTVGFEAHLKNVNGTAAGASLEGKGEIANLRIASASNKSDFDVGDVPLRFTSVAEVEGIARAVRGKRNAKRGFSEDPDAAVPRLLVGPVHFAPSEGLTVEGDITLSGYRFSARADAAVQRLLHVAHTFGIPALPAVVEGPATADLKLQGQWSGFAPPQVTGTASLKSARLELRGLGGPVEITAATIKLNTDRFDLTSLSATAAGTHWAGDISVPRGCLPPADCATAFHLQADELSTERLAAFLSPARETPWYRLTPDVAPATSWLRRVRASGTLAANRLLLASLSASHTAANVTLDNGVIRLGDVSGEVLGGKHHGKWDLDFTTQPSSYTGSGTFQAIELVQLAAAMHDAWITGTGSGKYQVQANGSNAKEVFASATGKLQLRLTNSALPHLLVENEPLKCRQFSGTLALKEGLFSLSDATLDSASVTYAVEGTATWNRTLDIKLVSESTGKIAVTGPLAAPHVAASRPASSQATLQQ
jgi:hypothetical protein